MNINTKIPKLRRFVLQNFPFIEADFDAVTDYQLLCKVVEYLNSVIQQTNNLTDATVGLIDAFNELKEFVEHYFDTLDVQDEINNKIDAMVEDGTLQALFTGYGLEIGEDNKVKVKAGTGITVDENGVSETPYEDYIQDVDVQNFHYTNEDTGADTTIYYSIIPSTYKPKVVMADPNQPNVRKYPSEFDYLYKPTLMLNAGPWKSSDGTTYGPLIVDGEIKVGNNLTGGTDTYETILGIKEDGEIVSINGETAAEDIDAQYAVRTWYTVIDHGLDKTSTMTTEKTPRSFFAQDVDGNYLIGTCSGRTYGDSGVSKQDIAEFLFYHVDGFNPKVAFCLDGGGSSCLMYKGIRQNPLVNNENRRSPNFIIFTSPTAKNKSVFESQSANNAKMIDIAQDKSTAWFSFEKLQSLIADEHVTLNATSIGRIVEGVLVTLNINITLTDTVASYGYLFENLPEFSHAGGHYFSASFRGPNDDAGNKLVQLYLINTEGRGCCIRNRYALPAGNYEINISYLTQP